MSLQIRLFEPDDRARVEQIWSLAFRGNQPYPEGRFEPEEGRDILVVEGEGGVVGACMVYETAFTCRGVALPSGALIAVAAAPECRQTGVGSAVMRGALEHMRQRGHRLSVLHAVRESYYRRFGYEAAGRQMEIRCPLDRFPKLTPSLPGRALSLDDWPQLTPAYEAMAASHSGMRQRDGLRWSRIHRARPDNPPLAWAIGDPVRAYALLRLKPGLHPSQEVSELVWADPEAYRSLLASLGRLGWNGHTLTWSEPADSPWLARHIDWNVEVHSHTLAMYRALHVPRCLSALSTRETGAFSIEVHDELLPGNRGPWRVGFSPGEVKVEPCAHADLVTDIRAFTQALLGEPSLASLMRHGLVQVRSEEALRNAERLLPSFPTYCLDQF